MSDSAALEFTVDNQFVLPVEKDLRIETSWISDCLL